MSMDLTMLAQVVCGRSGIEVISAPGHSFGTDGKKILVASNWAGGEDEHDILMGAICHEGPGHISNTDFDVMRKWRQGKSDLAGSLENVIEDIRIELAAMREYPGARRILSKMIAGLEKRGYFQLPDKNDHPGSILISYLIRALRAEELGQPLPTERMVELADQVFGPKVRRELLDIARRGGRGTQQDVLAAAEEILKALGDAANPPEPPSPPPQPQKGQGDKQEGDGSSGAPGQQESGNSPPGNEASGGKQPGSQGKDPQPGQNEPPITPEQSGNAQKALQASTDDIGSSDIGDMVSDVVSKDVRGGGPCTPSTNPSRRAAAPVTKSNFVANRADAALSVQLQSRMQDLLHSRAHDEDDSLTDCGRLDSHSIVRGVMGDRHIFTVEGEEAEGLDTAVFLLVDGSGSMSGDPETSALSAIYGMSSALAQFEQNGVAFALSLFRGDVTDLKSFDDPWPHARNCLNNYSACGGTQFPPCAKLVLPDLMKRHEKRKMLFVITDGDLGSAESNKLILGTAARYGVETRVLLISDGDCVVTSAKKTANGFTSMSKVSPGKDLQRAIYDTLAACI